MQQRLIDNLLLNPDLAWTPGGIAAVFADVFLGFGFLVGAILLFSQIEIITFEVLPWFIYSIYYMLHVAAWPNRTVLYQQLATPVLALATDVLIIAACNHMDTGLPVDFWLHVFPFLSIVLHTWFYSDDIFLAMAGNGMKVGQLLRACATPYIVVLLSGYPIDSTYFLLLTQPVAVIVALGVRQYPRGDIAKTIREVESEKP